LFQKTTMKEEIRWVRIFDDQSDLENFAALGVINTLTVEGKKICIVHTSKGFFKLAPYLYL